MVTIQKVGDCLLGVVITLFLILFVVTVRAQMSAGDLPSTGTLDDAVTRIQNRGLEIGTAVAKAEAELAKVGQQIDALQKYGARLELHLIALRSAKAAFVEAESAVRDEATTLTTVVTPTPIPVER